MDRLNEYIALIAESVAQLVQAHGAEAVKLGMFVIQMQYIQGLLYGVLFLILAGTALAVGQVLWRTGQRLEKAQGEMSRHDDAYRDPDPYLGFGLIIQVTSLAPFIVALVHLVNIYNWVGTFNPYAATALKVMEKVFDAKSK